jgi:galactokinase
VIVRAFAPGRVNLMGDHTDHTGGLVLPMAIGLGTTVEGRRGGALVELRSDHADDVARVPLDIADPASVEPPWARYVAGVVRDVRPSEGLLGTVRSTLPVGAGLSSSAALEVAVALAVGADGSPVELAQACRRAEQVASGVPCGIMDQLASTAGVDGAALRIDCHDLSVRPVPLPDDLRVLVVHSGEERALAGSAYAERAAACQAAEQLIGPLRSVAVEAVDRIADRTTRARARHVVAENRRVDAMAAALVTVDRSRLRELLAESHASLRDDFGVSTPRIDALVARLVVTPGVIGARLTGAGFGGCVVALCEAGTIPPDGYRWWWVRASGGAHVTSA